jgi:hypothetical protein
MKGMTRPSHRLEQSQSQRPETLPRRLQRLQYAWPVRSPAPHATARSSVSIPCLSTPSNVTRLCHRIPRSISLRTSRLTNASRSARARLIAWEPLKQATGHVHSLLAPTTNWSLPPRATSLSSESHTSPWALLTAPTPVHPTHCPPSSSRAHHSPSSPIRQPTHTSRQVHLHLCRVLSTSPTRMPLRIRQAIYHPIQPPLGLR